MSKKAQLTLLPKINQFAISQKMDIEKMPTTTGRIYTPDMAWCKNAMGILGISSFADLIHEWRKQCRLKRQQAFYARITDKQK